MKCKQCGKTYKPKLPTQEDCSEACLVIRFDHRVKKTRKLAKIYAATMGYRSMSEVRFAARLNKLKVPFDYEKDKLTYQHAPQKYTVDFTLKNKKTDEPIYIEYKGKLDAATRKKMRSIKRCNPDTDLRIVFEKPRNKIFKGSKTTYGEWATKVGYKWYDVKDYKKLKSDIRKGK